MANKVSIFIENSQGRQFELSNSKMALLLAKDDSTNWERIFNKKISPYSLILSDFSNASNVYLLIEEFTDEVIARNIMNKCREMLKKQYNRMMELRVGRKYGIEDSRILSLESVYFDPNNYKINIGSLKHSLGEKKKLLDALMKIRCAECSLDKKPEMWCWDLNWCSCDVKTLREEIEGKSKTPIDIERHVDMLTRDKKS